MSRRVLTLGTFDIPHAGHAAFLRACEAYGDVTVGVNSDRFVLEYRKTLPVYDETERMRLIAAMSYATLLNDGPGYGLIHDFQPDLLVVGSDWLRRDYLHQIGVSDPTFPILFLPYTEGMSTTDIKRRLMDRR